MALRGPYYELARVWPLVLFLLCAVQVLLPKLLLMTSLGRDSSSPWAFLRQPTRAGAGGATYFAYLLLAGAMCTFCTVLGKSVYITPPPPRGIIDIGTPFPRSGMLRICALIRVCVRARVLPSGSVSILTLFLSDVQER